MTTHATIAWIDPDGVEQARIYLHADGYRADAELAGFFDAEQRHVAAGCRGPRWHDPSYLAARFVHWYMGSDGTGVGIVPTGQSVWRVHYHWTVTCADRDKLPTVTRAED